MFLFTVLVNLLFFYSTTAESIEWIQCFNKTCPILNLKFVTSLNVVCMVDNPRCYMAHVLDQMDEFDDKFCFSTTSYPYDASIDQAIGIDLTKGANSVVYTCSNPFQVVDEKNQTIPQINGTAIYLNGKMYCSWSININYSPFPFELIDPPQYYLSERGYQIFYNLNQTVSIAPANYSKLPESVEPFVEGYKYKAVGSEKYLLIARVDNETTDFLLKVNGEAPRLVAINLKNDISLDIECNFKEKIVTAYAKHADTSFNIWDQVHDVKVTANECQWSLPGSINNNYGPVKPQQTVYELQIIENNRFVYFDEDNFIISTPTSASSALTVAKSLLIGLLFSVIFS